MRLLLTEIIAYTEAAPHYRDGLAIVQSGIEKKDVEPLVKWLHRLCDKYPGLSFMLVTSSHESGHLIERRKIKTGRCGRPRIVTMGVKAEDHFHALVINEGEDINIRAVKKQCTKYLNSRRKKRPNLKRQKIMTVWEDCLPIVQYMTRQMNETKPYTSGTFDFGYFDDVRYCKYPDDINVDIESEYEDILEP